MTGRVEHADGERRGPFPAHWGTPRGEPMSEERRVWVMNKTRRHVLDRKIASDAGLREAYMASKRVGP